MSLDVPALLAPWRAAGVLVASDIHIAAAISRLGGLGTADAPVAIAVALAARAPRLGHTCLDLATVRQSAPAEIEGHAGLDALGAVEALDWPADREAWRHAVVASGLTAPIPGGRGPEPAPPLVIDGDLVYLERYRVYEDAVVAELSRRAQGEAEVVPGEDARRDEVLEALLGPQVQAPDQWRAACSGAIRALSVIVGGPGTGKTRTVAALLAVLIDHDADLHIALAAPTGKAAARMAETFRATARELRRSDLGGAAALAARLEAAEAATIHRLLGIRPATVAVRHDRSNPLRHDVVIVDETSMVSLPLMAKLLDGIRPEARLVLVGDPGQLASVEAGSVLGDIAEAHSEPDSSPTSSGLVNRLTESYRFPSRSPVGRFAAAVRSGQPRSALEVLAGGSVVPDAAGVPTDGVRLEWIDVDADSARARAAVKTACWPTVQEMVAAARQGDAEGALRALGRVRVLCAHRRGPFGVAWWNHQIEQWLADDGLAVEDYYVGRPVLVTANDPLLGLFNGDLGVVVNAPDPAGEVRAPIDRRPRRRVVFPSGSGVRSVGPARLDAVETVHAMTIHKSQGSEFDRVVVLLPPPRSRLATRELLYTAITRARQSVTVVGTEASLRGAIERRVVRASGMAARLKNGEPPT